MSNNIDTLLEQLQLTSIDIPAIAKQHQIDPQHPGMLHGGRYWDASFQLMRYLQTHPLHEKSHIIDIGSGRGLSSVFCAKHFNANVSSLDADQQVIPFSQALAAKNQVTLHYITANYQELSIEQLRHYDYLIAADICFWDDMSEILIELVVKAITADIKKIIIADPGRMPFIAAAECCVTDYFAEIIEIPAFNELPPGYILFIENA